MCVACMVFQALSPLSVTIMNYFGYCVPLIGLRSLSVKETKQYQNNSSLPSCKNPHLLNEARCTTFLVKMSFICMRMKNDFHIKG